MKTFIFLMDLGYEHSYQVIKAPSLEKAQTKLLEVENLNRNKDSQLTMDDLTNEIISEIIVIPESGDAYTHYALQYENQK